MLGGWRGVWGRLRVKPRPGRHAGERRPGDVPSTGWPISQGGSGHYYSTSKSAAASPSCVRESILWCAGVPLGYATLVRPHPPRPTSRSPVGVHVDSAHHTAMVRLAANLSFLFKERPFLDRFQAAAAAGFRAVPHTPSCCRSAAVH